MKTATITPAEWLAALCAAGFSFWSNETGEHDIWTMDGAGNLAPSVEIGTDEEEAPEWVVWSHYRTEEGGLGTEMWSSGRSLSGLLNAIRGAVLDATSL